MKPKPTPRLIALLTFLALCCFTGMAALTGAADGPPTQSAAQSLLVPKGDGAGRGMTPSSAQVTIAHRPGGGGQLDVTVRPGKDQYPGVTLTPEGKPWDLSRFGHIDARVVNTGAALLNLALRVDNDGDWKLNPWNSENATLKPGESATVRVRFGYSWGRRAYRLDPSKVTRVLLFANKSEAEQAFRIEGIEAGGSPGEKPAVPPDRMLTKPKGGLLLGPGQIVARHAQIEPPGAGGTGGARVTAAQGAPADAGALLKPASGRWDLRDWTQVTVRARNAGKAPLSLRARLESAGGNSEWVTAAADPGGAVDLVLPFGGPVWTGAPHSGPQFESDAATGVAVELPAGPGPDAERAAVIESVRAELPPPALPDWLGKRPPVEGKWTQTLDENFDGDTIDASRWSVLGENYWDPRSHFSKANSFAAGGLAHLRFERRPGHHNDDPKRPETDYATGFLSSFGKWTQRYGYFEARMKLPKAPGLWPAFWMMPDRGPSAGNHRQATEDGGMEFDIMEHLTRFGPNRYNIALHWDGYAKGHKSVGTDRIYCRPDAQGFITSGMLWEPGRVAFYCNGRRVGEWENPRVSDVPAYLMFTLPSGGWDGNDLADEDAGLPDEFQIDWVRAWQRDDLAAAPPHGR